MAFACQRDSYLKSLSTVVSGCEEAYFTYSQYGKKQSGHGYSIILADTILFPEGGGQPFDFGKINDVEVIAVLRQKEQAIHYTLMPINVGEVVVVTVDWSRRFDHMQQHSSQHLITAVVQKKYSWQTTSWNLGEKISSIELGTSHIKTGQIKEIEYEVNSLIRECIPVKVKTLDHYKAKLDMDITIDSKEIPPDAAGPIRVVSIEGIDNNLCCGTHVKNLSDLQMIKILNTGKGKKGKTLLNFIAGNRILENIDNELRKQVELTKILSGGPEEHAGLVKKLHSQTKEMTKNSKLLLKNLAVKEAELLRFKEEQSLNKEKLFVLHTPSGNLEFMNVLSSEIENIDQDILVFLTVGDEHGKGLYLLSGSKDVLNQHIANRIAEILDGRGAMKNGKCHGKADKMKNIKQVVDYLRQVVFSDN